MPDIFKKCRSESDNGHCKDCKSRQYSSVSCARLLTTGRRYSLRQAQYRLERADTLGENIAKETALFHQLENQVGNLEQEVEDLASIFVLAVRMFQIEGECQESCVNGLSG